jgi:hypothetical protein
MTYNIFTYLYIWDKKAIEEYGKLSALSRAYYAMGWTVLLIIPLMIFGYGSFVRDTTNTLTKKIGKSSAACVCALVITTLGTFMINEAMIDTKTSDINKRDEKIIKEVTKESQRYTTGTNYRFVGRHKYHGIVDGKEPSSIYECIGSAKNENENIAFFDKTNKRCGHIEDVTLVDIKDKTINEGMVYGCVSNGILANNCDKTISTYDKIFTTVPGYDEKIHTTNVIPKIEPPATPATPATPAEKATPATPAEKATPATATA